MNAGARVSADLSMGSEFAGRYRIERCIAAGGMGAVYEVVHIETNRRRALKVMHAEYVSSDELRKRFRQEARVAAEIESEHIVDVFDAGVDEATGMPFLVMELLRGEELGRLSKRVGPLPKEHVVRYLYETSLALQKTHRANIVHRDLKPDNLFLCERDHGPPRIKVLDFGIAKILKDSETQANATRSLGTPLYMAPEQFLLQAAVSSATDIFALGMIAFTLLVGKPYWLPESKMAGEMLAFAMHVAKGPREPAVTRAWELFGVELPQAFDTWFFQATAHDPDARFASAKEAVIALADALGVSLSTEAFVPKDAWLNTSRPALERPVLASTSRSGPQTGPTQLAITPGAEPKLKTQENGHRPSRWFVVTASTATVVLGMGLLFVVKRSSSPRQDEPTQQASAQRTSNTSSVITSNNVRVEPAATLPATIATASAVPSTSASAQAQPRPSSRSTQSTQPAKPPMQAAQPAPIVTTTKPATPKKGTGDWTAD